MKTLLLSLLCLFVWCQTTEALTDQQVVLGQSVTLACEYRLKGVIWFVMKLPARPEMILRTFGSKEKAEYYDEKFREKYSEGDRSQLVINNVSDDDLGIYYCIKPGFALQISDGIRLNTAVHKDSLNTLMTLSSSTSFERHYKHQPEHKFNLNKRSTSSQDEDAAAFTALSVCVVSNHRSFN
ncbi:hypothetical protein ROHU_017767 [Labeo rohita]|uniref:Immunoglobulin domain-containing protein n=1 Tax=Labeo rohita TaxID=84645 RepID=A0A498N8H5_LABRO|nr:hypothetical protein ROHU_017767 [Labeo rohita]